jgi:hypothetical protein
MRQARRCFSESGVFCGVGHAYEIVLADCFLEMRMVIVGIAAEVHVRAPGVHEAYVRFIFLSRAWARIRRQATDRLIIFAIFGQRWLALSCLQATKRI